MARRWRTPRLSAEDAAGLTAAISAIDSANAADPNQYQGQSKTLAKMSPTGREATGAIALSKDVASIVERALLATPPGGSPAESGPGTE